jgi:UDP-glucose 4-epimerase
MIPNSPFNNVPALVTGGCGFIGSHIAQELIALGAHVTIIDNLSTGTIANIEHIKDHIRFIQATITDPEECLRATQGQHLVFHLAALVSVPKSIEQPRLCHTINVDGTFNILEAARINKVKRVIFSSSAAVYGNTTEQCREDMPCNPQSPYGSSKRIGELLCQQYATSYNLETVILRYFNVYGPRQKPDGAYASVHAKFSYLIKHNRPITIYGDGLQTRDFIHVNEIVRANLTAGMATIIPGDIFNVASGNSITLLELVHKLKEQFPQYDQKINFEPARPGDLKYSSTDCSKYRTLTQQYHIGTTANIQTIQLYPHRDQDSRPKHP